MMHELEDLRKFFSSLGRPAKLATTGQGEIDLHSPTGVLMAQIKTAVSEHEIAMMRVRQLRAARQRAKQGRPKWKRAYGYVPDTRHKDDDDGTREINAKQQARVEAAYKAVVRGEKITHIANEWNKDESNYGFTGKPWSASTLSLFLRSPRNAGLREHNGEIVRGEDGKPVKATWDPLVDMELWRAAQTVLNGNAHGPKSVRKHLLTGVMRCGRDGCSGYLAGNWVMQANGTGHAITYTCKSCRGVSVRAEHVEPLVIGALIKRMSRPDAVKLLRKKVYDAEEAEQLNVQEAVLLARLKEIARERAKGLIDGVGYYEMAEIINADLAAIEQQRQDQECLRVTEGIPLGTDKVADAVEALPPDRLRKAIDLLAVVTVLPVGKGHKVFNHERVDIAWK
jgi:hypothetical protein